jgi:hypothetical protein
MKTVYFRMGAALAGLLWLAGATSTRAAVITWNSGFADGGVVPDGNFTGWSDTRTLSGYSGTLSQLRVTLQLDGGWNGDFYAYLAHGSDLCVLLNRVGRAGTLALGAGYGDAYLSVVLDDAAVNGDVHQYQNMIGYAGLIGSGASFKPDGRAVSPLLALDTVARTSLLDQFLGQSADGDWTLFVADVSGGEQGTVLSWGLDIQTVPEPGSLALAGVVGLVAAGMTWRHWRRPARR